jgi:hypothetical protein
MRKSTRSKRQPGLALGAGLAFLAAAIVEALASVLNHRPSWYPLSAAGFAFVALLWFIVYGSWKRDVRD